MCVPPFFPPNWKSLVVVVLIFLLITFLLLLIKIIWSFHTINKGGGGKLPDAVENTGLFDPMELYTVTVLYFKCTFCFCRELLSQGIVTPFKLELKCWLYLEHICICCIDILSGVQPLKKRKSFLIHFYVVHDLTYCWLIATKPRWLLTSQGSALCSIRARFWCSSYMQYNTVIIIIIIIQFLLFNNIIILIL